MGTALRLAAPGNGRPPGPDQLASVVRQEIPGLAEEIISEIRGRIPEYARPLDGPYGRALRTGVSTALTTFADLLADPAAPREQRDCLCRRLGEGEWQEGRSLEALQTAYRTGVQVTWRRAMVVAQRLSLPADAVCKLADAVIAYGGELAALSEAGYLEAKRRSGDGLAQCRRRLLRLILEDPPAPQRAITELAALARWELPAEVTLVATAPGPGQAGALADDMLASLDGPQPHILVPGPLDERRLAAIEPVVTSAAAAAGPTVPLVAAADSLRWARKALAAARDGCIRSSGLIRCEEHLMTLWLRSDPALVQLIAERHFPALQRLAPAKRAELLKTFAAWLEYRGKAAEHLRVHPQTVRYRLRQLRDLLGSRLDDPMEQFALGLISHATPPPAASGSLGHEVDTK
jgi:hypothetical protein